MLLRALVLNSDGAIHDLEDGQSAIEAVGRADGLVWIDLEGRDDDGIALLESLGFDSLSVNTALDEHHSPPKVVRYEDHLFVLAHGIDYYSESEKVQSTELGLFLGKHYLVTCHRLPADAVEHIWSEFRTEPTHIGRRGADFLAHAVLATLVANLEPAIEGLGNIVERVEAEIIDDPGRVHLDLLNQVKRTALRLSRVLQPERLSLRRLPERARDLVSPEGVFYFDDLADDVEFLESTVAGVGERANIAFSTYLSVVSIRQNESVKVLSILAFVFLPLTLVVGIYGMNFDHMPELQTRYGYFVVLGIIVAALALMTIWIFFTQRAFRQEATTALTRLLVVEPRRVSGYGAALARWPKRIAAEVATNRHDETDFRGRG